MLYYKEYGNLNGKLILFIHGGFTTCESFMRQYEILKEYHCVFVDLPNHGKSDYGEIYRFSFEKAADTMIKLIEHFSPKEKVILISHSYGGLTTKIIMSKIPEKIEKVVIGSTNIQRTFLFWIYTTRLGCAVLWIQNRKRYKKDNISWKLICDTQKSAWRNFQLFELTKKDLSKIKCLLLYGQYDIKSIKVSMYLWKKYLSNSQIMMIKNVGHNYFFDAADQMNSIIKMFVQS